MIRLGDNSEVGGCLALRGSLLFDQHKIPSTLTYPRIGVRHYAGLDSKGPKLFHCIVNSIKVDITYESRSSRGTFCSHGLIRIASGGQLIRFHRTVQALHVSRFLA